MISSLKQPTHTQQIKNKKRKIQKEKQPQTGNVSRYRDCIPLINAFTTWNYRPANHIWSDVLFFQKKTQFHLTTFQNCLFSFRIWNFV